jgi:lambda family phage tail tape measure protein
MVQGVTVDFNANIARFISSVDKLTNDLNKFQSHTARIGNNINGILRNFGVGLSASGVVYFVKTSIDALDKLYISSQRVGLGAKDYAGLEEAYKQAGGEAEAMSGAIDKLNKQIGIASSGQNDKLAQQLKILGVDVKGGTLPALLALSDRFAALPDVQQRAALSTQLFGKNNAQMGQFLAQGSKAIEEQVKSFGDLSGVTQKNAAEANKLNDQLSTLKLSVHGLANSFISEILPGMNDTVTAMLKLQKEGHGVEAVLRGIAGVGKIPWDIILGNPNVVEDSKARIAELQDQLQSLQRATPENVFGNLFNKLFGKDDERLKKIEVIKNQIAVLEKYGDQIDKKFNKPSAAPKSPVDLSAINDARKSYLDAYLKEQERGVTAEGALLASRNRMLDSYNAQNLLSVQDYYDGKTNAQAEQVANSIAFYDKEIAALQNFGTTDINEQARIDDQIAALRDKRNALEQKANEDSLMRQTELRTTWLDGAKDATNEFIRNAEDAAARTKELWADAYKGATDAIVNFVKTSKLNIGEFTNVIITDLLRIQTQKLLAGFAGNFSFGGGGGGSIDGVTGGQGNYFASPTAKGDVFGYANGGIVNSPTLFKYASGGGFNTGLMGEAGPEAVMPLARDSSGRLGVRGGGGINIVDNSVYHIDSSTDRAMLEQRMRAIGDQKNAELVDRLRRQRVI